MTTAADPLLDGLTSLQIGAVISAYRDWRISLQDPSRSVVFVAMDTAGGRIVPCSGTLPNGTDLRGIFELIARGIREAREALEKPTRSMSVCVEGVWFRAEQRANNTYHLRTVTDLLEFDKLGLPAALVSNLMSNNLENGGLVIVCGSYGSGKTTTVTSVVRERVSRKGGLAVVMGSPVEYRVEGFHGVQSLPGYIEQVDVAQGELLEEIHSVMRSFAAASPGIIVFPELRSTECVGEMLRTANRGNLVFLDMHAVNIDAAIINLVSMADQDGEKLSRVMIGNALRLIVHQQLSYKSNGGYKVTYDYTVPQRQTLAAIQDVNIPLAQALTGLTNLGVKSTNSTSSTRKS